MRRQGVPNDANERAAHFEDGKSVSHAARAAQFEVAERNAHVIGVSIC
jgi:hypothetical protein